MCSGSEEGSYLGLVDFCITQLESNKEEEEEKEPLHTGRDSGPASERRGKNSKGFKDVYLKAKAIIWR